MNYLKYQYVVIFLPEIISVFLLRIFQTLYFQSISYISLIILYFQQHPPPYASYEVLLFLDNYAPNPFPDLLCYNFFLSSALMLFCFLINYLVISKNASSTPLPTLALVFNTLRLCSFSNSTISWSVTSTSRS